MRYAEAVKRARAVLGEVELRDDFLEVCERVARALAADGASRESVAQALGRAVDRPGEVADKILTWRFEAPTTDWTCPARLAGLPDETARAADRAIATATRPHLTGGRVARLGRALGKLTPAVAAAAPEHLVAIVEHGLEAVGFGSAKPVLAVRVVEAIKRETGAHAPWRDALMTRQLPDEVADRLTALGD